MTLIPEETKRDYSSQKANKKDSEGERQMIYLSLSCYLEHRGQPDIKKVKAF